MRKSSFLFFIFVLLAPIGAHAADDCKKVLAGELKVLTELAQLKTAIDEAKDKNPEIARTLYRTYLTRYKDAQKAGLDMSRLTDLQKGEQKQIDQTNTEIKARESRAIEKDLKLVPFIKTQTIRTKMISSIDVSRDGNYAVTGTHEKVILWDTKTWKPSHELEFGEVASVRFSPDGKSFAVAHDHYASVYAVDSGDKIYSVNHNVDAMAVAFSPDGKFLAVAGETQNNFDEVASVTIVDAKTGKLKFRLRPRIKHFIASMGFSPDGQLLAFGGHSDLAVWDFSARKETHQFELAEGSAFSLAFSPEGSTLAIAAKTLIVIDSRTGKKIFEKSGGRGDFIERMAYSPDGSVIVTTMHDEKTIAWDPKSGKKLATVKSLAGKALAFSPDGSNLYVGEFPANIVILQRPVPVPK